MTLAMLPTNPTERHFLPVLVIMFVAGVALGIRETVSWWKARMTQLRPPPLTKLITYVRESDGDWHEYWHPTHVLWFPLPQRRRAIPEELKPSTNRPKKVSVNGEHVS